MPGVPATGSENIALVDSRIIADLCLGKICVDATPSVYIASGKDNVLGANIEIINPYGVTVKPYGANYEIAPALSGGMDAAICFNIPTQAGNYQYGQYTVNLKMFDADGSSWVVTKKVSLCEPDKNNKTRSYGSLSARLLGSCKDGKLTVIVDNVPTYNGTLVESQVNSFTLEYPTSSGLPVLSTSLGSFSVVLFEGVYKFAGEICATYNFGDNVYVKVKYKVKKEKNIRCLIDECCVFTALTELNAKLRTNCTLAERENTSSQIFDALRLLKTAQLAADCGEDPSDVISELEALLGCKCTCNCAEGTPVINQTPTGDFVIEGCNTSKVEVGLTTTWTINNYEYVIEVADNGGALVISAPVLDNCTKTQTITFDIAVVYNQIKNLANQNNTEADFWASVINKSLRDVDPACFGYTALQWQALSYAAKWTSVVTKICACCGTCGSTITNVVVTQDGSNVLLSWQGVAYSYEVYLDGTLVKTILTSATDLLTYLCTFENAADGGVHSWLIISRCSNGAIGATESGEFQYLGCAEIAPPSLSQGSHNGECPFDLTSVESEPPEGVTYEWHNANNTNENSIVGNPQNVSDGIYYVFAKNIDGCYSGSVQFPVICDAGTSCTAPQNLTVTRLLSCDFLIQFQSAAYPPPGNSYTVKRKLASDPDIDGSYTTIGTPVWNAGINRWVICDTTSSNYNLYTYKAISNCGDSPATTPSTTYEYAYIPCPLVTLTPTDTTVDYSLSELGGSIDKYEVSIWDSTGTVLIHTDTHVPAFSEVVSGTFEYLTPETTYKVKVKIFIGTYSKTCITNSAGDAPYNVTTTA